MVENQNNFFQLSTNFIEEDKDKIKTIFDSAFQKIKEESYIIKIEFYFDKRIIAVTSLEGVKTLLPQLNKNYFESLLKKIKPSSNPYLSKYNYFQSYSIEAVKQFKDETVKFKIEPLVSFSDKNKFHEYDPDPVSSPRSIVKKGASIKDDVIYKKLMKAERLLVKKYRNSSFIGKMESIYNFDKKKGKNSIHFNKNVGEKYKKKLEEIFDLYSRKQIYINIDNADNPKSIFYGGKQIKITKEHFWVVRHEKNGNVLYYLFRREE
ncbi:MAG: hypothetical protein GY754_04780 [bacterium]|nr:hypothetical protein [bacterium]